MMTDRELLGLAAKAAGYEFSWGATPLIKCYEPEFPEKTHNIWNPLDDDGDALRLAVSLRLKVSPGNGLHEDMVSSYVNSSLLGTYPSGCTEKYGDNPCAATRRAIVRAAAEIVRTR